MLSQKSEAVVAAAAVGGAEVAEVAEAEVVAEVVAVKHLLRKHSGKAGEELKAEGK